MPFLCACTYHIYTCDIAMYVYSCIRVIHRLHDAHMGTIVSLYIFLFFILQDRVGISVGGSYGGFSGSYSIDIRIYNE